MTDEREHLASLPVELCLLVAEDPCLSTKDLFAFALTSRWYSDLAIKTLYRKNIREENASALLWAVLEENTEIIARLIQYGADINSVEASTHLDQPSPYRWIKRLRGWDSHTEDNDSRLALDARHPLSTARLLRNLNAINAVLPFAHFGAGTAHNPGPFAPLLAASRARQWRQRNARREFRFAPLALAARKGLTTATKFLLENGADPQVPSRDLCRCDNEPLISRGMWRVPHQANRPIMDQPHWTALHLAIHYGHKDIVRLLVEHGADTRQVCRSTEDGPCSALHTAFIHKRVSIVEFLMDRFKGTDKADIDARGRGGITPLHIAYCVQPRTRSLVDLALKFNAFVNFEYEIDGNQWTLFAMACVAEDWKFALRLLKLGANAGFDLEHHFGGRWTLDDFHREMAWSNSDEFDLGAAALVQELDQIKHDHKIAFKDS